jgi:hypothetical protein
MGKRVFFGYLGGWAIATIGNYCLREAGLADAAYDKLAEKIVAEIRKVS